MNRGTTFSRVLLLAGGIVALPVLLDCNGLEATGDDEVQLPRRRIDDPTEAGAPTARCARPLVEPETELSTFFDLHGRRAAFSPLEVDAVTTFINAESLYFQCDYRGANDILAPFWQRHPRGEAEWTPSASPAAPGGTNVGNPRVYHALGMLTEAVKHRLTSIQTPEPSKVVMTVVLVGCSKGLQARSQAELDEGTGIEIENSLDPGLRNGAEERVLESSIRLFREYMRAITEGRLDVQPRVVELLDVCLPAATAAGTPPTARIASFDAMWAAIPEPIKATTDYWWAIYPSHIPEHAAFRETEFSDSSGMRTPPDSRAPVFISEDKWLLRKRTPHGDGALSDLERRISLPQWLQHELFHHLFREYPSLGLETTAHRWFDRTTWPADFVGVSEPDYFHEAFHKRLAAARPPLHVKLRYAPAAMGTYFRQLTNESVVGSYQRRPVQNGWHSGRIESTESGLVWRNDAGIVWRLVPDLARGKLLNGPDNPYFEQLSAKAFTLALRSDPEGNPLPAVRAFQFLGEEYELQ